MRPTDDIERIVKRMSFQAGPETDRRVWADTRKAQEQSHVRTASPSGSLFGRRIMRNPRMQLATAAVIAVAVVLFISLWDKSTPAAYALEQTIQAGRSIRYLEIRDFETGKDGPKELWLEFDDAGQIKRMRNEMPAWGSPGDGPKVSVWQKGKATIWFKAKNALLTVQEESITNQLMGLVRMVDPTLMLQHFSECEKAGVAQIQIEEPANKTEPIVVTCTQSPQVREAGFADRSVLFIDQATKLVTKIEKYGRTSNGGYELSTWIEFRGYNEPIAPALFALEDVPADVVRVDQTVQEVGVEQGDLSDQQVAVKAVREFYEALIAKDYAKAGRLVGGVPAAKIEEVFRGVAIVRIVSIGTAQPNPNPRVGGLLVSCQLEVEKNGVKSVWELPGVGVRPGYKRPHQWLIDGGVMPD